MFDMKSVSVIEISFIIVVRSISFFLSFAKQPNIQKTEVPAFTFIYWVLSIILIQRVQREFAIKLRLSTMHALRWSEAMMGRIMGQPMTAIRSDHLFFYGVYLIFN